MGSHFNEHTKEQLASDVREQQNDRSQQLRRLACNYQETKNKLIVAGFVIEGLKNQLKQQENMMKKLRTKQYLLDHLKLRLKSEQEALENKYATAVTQVRLLSREQEQKVWKLKSRIQKYKNFENETRDENRRMSQEVHQKDEQIKDLKCTLSNLNSWSVR